MKTSNNKPQVDIEQLTQRFYDWIVFPLSDPELLQKYLSLFWDYVLDWIENFSGDTKFLDRNVFCDEMTAIRLELFSLACDQKFGKKTIDLSLEKAPIQEAMKTGSIFRLKKKGLFNEEVSVQLSALMKRRLEQMERLDTWEVMGEYNYALRESRYLPYASEQQEKMDIAFNLIRSELLDKWEESGVDIRCVTRVVNRMNIDAYQWNSVAIKRLAVKFAQRLEAGSHLLLPVIYSPGRQIVFAAVIHALYIGAKEFLLSNETGIDMDEPIVVAGKQIPLFLESLEDPWDYYISEKYLESTYRADGSGFGILFDYWSSK